MTFSRAAFTDYNVLKEPILIRTANGAAIKGMGYGIVSVRIILPNRAVRSINIRVSAVIQKLSRQVYTHAKEGRFVLTPGGDQREIGTRNGRRLGGFTR
jgi:hypothetical protein